MKNENANWYSVSSYDSLTIVCANCETEIDLPTSFLDHHSNHCLICNAEYVFLDWKNKKIQIVLQNAPKVLIRVIQYLQTNYDELEYIELLACLDEMTNSIR